MTQKAFKIIIKHRPTTFRHSPMQKVGLVRLAVQNSMPFVRSRNSSPSSRLWWKAYISAVVLPAPFSILSLGFTAFPCSQQKCIAFPFFLWNFFSFVFIECSCVTKRRCRLSTLIFSSLFFFLWISSPAQFFFSETSWKTFLS